ncbi:hypothetical protein [Tepidibacter formicigenes]|jgi:hypothetical protein|uniref:Uncharacterized protein n=1 Tax=Tepidibacter formicigenes DSM 15518 TaxID=1123349 RepID=A0A1M6MAU5_9FIRM|nr:hypothetical protein [Tepidibacter formicigenes]SHJ80572.1 hypothetical protein SAMN02744037_00885 [Tepidibacter formicigenes DSM 15518]
MNELAQKFDSLSEKEKIEFIKEIIPSVEKLVKENKDELMKEFYPIINNLLDQYGITMEQVMLMLQMFKAQN